LRHSLAVVVHDPEVELRLGEALVGSFAIPLHRLGIVLRHSLAGFVSETDVALGLGDALIGQRTKESKRGRVVAAIVGGHAVLKRSCNNPSGKAYVQEN